MYVTLELILCLNDGSEISYFRDERPDDGYFYILNTELRNINTVADLIEVLEKGELLHLSDGDLIDIDDFCKSLIVNNGEEFIPDENEEWYLYEDRGGHKLGISGEDLVEYWNAFQKNQKVKNAFIKKIKGLDEVMADRIIIKKTYDSFGMPMDDLYEDEIYTVKLN